MSPRPSGHGLLKGTFPLLTSLIRVDINEHQWSIFWTYKKGFPQQKGRIEFFPSKRSVEGHIHNSKMSKSIRADHLQQGLHFLLASSRINKTPQSVRLKVGIDVEGLLDMSISLTDFICKDVFCKPFQGGIKCGNRGTGFLDSEGSHR